MNRHIPNISRARSALAPRELATAPIQRAGACTNARWLPGAQRGVALVVALILLVVITLVGLAAVSGTIMQGKMAANQYDRQTAFQNAASGLRVAQLVTQAQIKADPEGALPSGWRDCSRQGNVCLSNPFTDTNLPTGSVYPVSAGTAPGEYTAAILATGQPEYVIEYMGKCWSDPKHPVVQNTANGKNIPNGTHPYYASYYRVTARSGDPANVGDRAIVTLQSVVLASGQQPADGHGKCQP